MRTTWGTYAEARGFFAQLRERAGSALLLITGSPVTTPMRDLPTNADTLKIPTIVTSGAEGRDAHAPHRRGRTRRVAWSSPTRRALELEPDVLLVDNFRSAPGSELLPVLRELRHRPTRTVLGLRDVVDPPASASRLERDAPRDFIERYYDRVIVYGVPRCGR